MASVKVAVRVRPINKRELELNCPLIINMEGNNTLITNTKLPNSPSLNESFGRERVKQFTYDYSYWSLDPNDPRYCSQQKVFDELGCEVVDSAFSGYNACVFAYGQTGSGKTYTMMGTPDNYGITPRVCESLFSRMYDTETSYRTEISYLEIYNERVRDLLRDRTQPQLNLRVREHPKEGPYVQELSKHVVMSYADIEQLISRGNLNRTTASTNMNDHSSRSHAIFTIGFTQAKFADDLPSEVHSKIHLVDLAGSERADAAGTSGDRLKEGGSINKSLVTLGNVISTLADISNRSGGSSVQRRSIFIPYRDSLLTWLLKDSLGGNSRTIMIATISPAECHYAETLSTLRYAKRAKKILNKPVINEDPNVKLIRELRAENARLRALLGNTAVQTALTPLKEFVETKEQLTRNEEKVQELIEEWTDKWTETASILQEHKTLGLRKEGAGIVLDSDLPYLFCIDDDVLSTGMLLYHLKEGDTIVGRDDAPTMPDIVLVGRGIEASHCIIRYLSGAVSLLPLDGAVCYVNNTLVQSATPLSQGALIRLGSSHIFRFNNPLEAAKLREQVKGKNCSLLSVGNDLWTCSTMSMTDSAVGSDFGDNVDEFEKLEEKRRQLERLEVDNQCLSHPQPQTDNVEHLGRQQTTANISEEINEARQSSEVDRQQVCPLAEWAELEKRAELEKQRKQQELVLSNVPQRHLDTETKVFAADLHEMRRLVDEELQTIRHMTAGLSPSRRTLNSSATSPQYLGTDSSHHSSVSSLPYRVNAGEQSDDDDSSSFDVESLKLKLSFDDDVLMNGLPDAYLAQSPVTMENIVNYDSPNRFVLDGEANASTLCCHLGNQVELLHARVCESLQRKYSSVLRCDDYTKRLGADVIQGFSHVKPLFEHLEQVTSENSDIDFNIVDKLLEFDRLLSTVDKFIQIHESLARLDIELSEQRYLDVVSSLESIHRVVAMVTIETELEASVLKVLQTEICIARERLLYELGETWNQLFHWSLPADSRRARPVVASLDVGKNPAEKKRLGQVVMAMSRVNMLQMRVKTLTDRVLNHFVDPVVNFRSTTVQTIDEPNRATISVVVDHTVTSSGMGTLPVPPADAFHKLEQILTFLHAAFDGILIDHYMRDFHDPEIPETLIETFGGLLSMKLFDRVYDGCILPSMPTSEGGVETWTSFGTVMSDTEKFQATLGHLGFLPRSSGFEDEVCSVETLMDRLNNANAKFANVRGQELLRQAHRLMTAELSNSVRVSGERPIGSDRDFSSPAIADLDKFVKVCREQAASSGLKLPSCQISVAVRDLVCLAYETLREALASSQEAAYHLCNSVHNMLEFYADLATSIHHEKLATLPLAAALHHNNSMFIAHHVIVIDKAFRQKLLPESGALTPSSDGLEPALAELVPRMRRLGHDSFTAYLDGRKEQMSRLIADTSGFTCIADDSGECVRELIRNLLHHLKHLAAVWNDVLPLNVYLRNIGYLLNAALSDIISTVLSIDEFSVDDCECLQNVLEYLSAGAVDLFRPPTSPPTPGSDSSASPEVTVQEVSPEWLRVRELALLVGASLQDVDDRWSEGKGPSALYFSGEEVAKLVAAAFEKTSRRDALIARLHRHHNKTCSV